MRETQPRLLVLWGKHDLSFELSEPEAYRRDVPNGTNRGQGVTAGGHPSSREDAFKTLDAFLKQHL